MKFSVYILYSKKLNRNYIGSTGDFTKRLEEHNSGYFKEAFTLKGIPWETILIIENLHSKQAFEIELYIKRMKSKRYIESLFKYPEIIIGLQEKFK